MMKTLLRNRLWLLVLWFLLCTVQIVGATAPGINPRFTAISSTGAPWYGAQLYTYVTGTTTPKTTWTDSTKGTPNTNPITLDQYGQADVWLDSSTGGYRLRLVDPEGVEIWTKDSIYDSASVASETVAGVVRQSTDAEIEAGSNITAFVAPDQFKKYNGFIDSVSALKLRQGYDGEVLYLRYHTSPSDGGDGVFYWDADSVLSDNGGTIIQVTGVEVGRWVRQLNGFVTPEMFGLVTDNSTAIQAAWEYCEANGAKLVFQEKTYTCGTELDFRISSLKYHSVIDGNGAILDFSGSGITSGDLVQIGADNQAYVNENTKFVVSGLRVKGPNIGTPGDADTPTTTTTGIRLQYALGLSISDTAVTQCYMGYEAGFCFPVVGTNVSADGCYIGLYLLDDMTDGVWNGCQFKEGRFGIVAAPTSTAVYGQTFINCDLEGNKVGCALDPGTDIIHDIMFIQPYLEAVTYDGFRVNRSVNLADASDDGSDRAANLYNLTIKGGVWNGTWGAPASHQPIRFHDADTAAAPAGCIIMIPVNLSTCSVGYYRKSTVGNSIDISIGAVTNVALNPTQMANTWTPAITFDGNAVGVTYGSRYGRYVKTGNQVSFTGRITLTSKGSSKGVFRITGLPFTSQATVPGVCYLTRINDISSTTLPSAIVETSATTITLWEYSSGTGDIAEMQDVDISNTTTLYFGGHYYTTF